MKLYIIRHGETYWNIEGRMQGTKDSKLTEQGKKEALNLGENLKDTKIDCIYSSPLERAYDTSVLIRGEREIPIEIKSNLIEMNFGKWEGMLSDDVEKLYKNEHYRFWNEPHLYTTLDGETFEELIKRVKITLDEIVNQNKGEHVLLVTHAIVIKAIYAIVKGYKVEEFWNPPFIKNTCVTIIEHNKNNYNITLEASTSHVDS